MIASRSIYRSIKSKRAKLVNRAEGVEETLFSGVRY